MPRQRQRRRHRRHQHRFRQAGRWIVNSAATASLPALLLGFIAVMTPVALTLPMPRLPADSLIYDRYGHLVSLLYTTQNRIPLSYAEIPPVMQNALTAVEDDTFWTEPAVDPVGILRAAFVDITHHAILQGGSTLTQQLAKNLYLTDRRTFSRKFKELFITMKISATHSKQQILTDYLNDVYFGQGAYGVEAASQIYFGHGVRHHLTLPEAALLAGVVNAPSAYDPLVHPGLARARRNTVLALMAKLHYLSPATAKAAEAAPLGLHPTAALGDRAPYFTSYLVQQLKTDDPHIAKTLYTGGYHIQTSLNWSMQKAAAAAVAHWIPPATGSYQGVRQPQAALVAIDPRNGDVEAMVGGTNYAKTPLNRAVFASRQPGSTMKYFLYTTVINDGYPTSTVRDSAPVRFPAGNGTWYVPHNYGHVYNGHLTMRRAIAMSDNIIATKWMATVGPPAMIRMAHSMGIDSPLADNLTTALGSSSVTPLEMARGVATLANGGQRVRPVAVLKVANTQGHVLYQTHPHLTRVLSPAVAYVVTNLFSAPLLNAAGTAHNLEPIIRRPAAAKTGTSSKQRDGWLVGFTPQLAAAVWVGNDNDTPMGLTGDLGAGPIWAHFMKNALAGRAKRPFPVPPGVVTQRVCVRTGLLAASSGCCTSYHEVFVKGHTPTHYSPGCSPRAKAPIHRHRRSTTLPPSLSRILRSILGHAIP